MNNKDDALMRAWAEVALENEGHDPRRDAVARFILKNIDDPYEGVEVGSVCIVKFGDEERVALRGKTRWYLCENDEAFSDVTDVVEVVSELVPKDDPSPLIPEEDWQNASDEHPKVLETEDDYRNAPAGTVVAVDNCLPRVKDDTGFWLYCGGSNGDANSVMAFHSRRVLRWGETL